MYVEDIMHRDSSVPLVSEDDSVTDALVEMTSKGLGMTGVVGAEGRLTGIFTDGDLRRALNRSVDVYGCRIADVMTRNPYTLAPGDLAVELVKAMEKHSINGVFVVDHGGRVLGALNAHDLFRAGVI